MFDPVNPHQSFPELEKGILEYWRLEDTFKRSVKNRRASLDTAASQPTRDDVTYSFYDGPPFATGLPHYGHLLAGTIKDVIPRYQTMKGKVVERRFGWDCHGLPIENLVEQENDIKNKQEIEKKGVKWFNELCRGSVQRYTSEWRKTVERMGRWVDMDWDYRTMDPEYMESMWWAFEQLYKKGLVYEGYKPMHICTRCVTPLSNFEVTQGYRDRTDMSVIITFPLKDDPKTVLLAWTTTPWSLPGNFWLAVGAHITYVKVKEGDTTYILAQKLVEKVFKDREYEVLGEIDPHELKGKKYEPLFPYFVDTVMPSSESSGTPVTYGDKVFHVVMSDAVEVSDEEGTGIVHITSCLGEDSYTVAQEYGVDVLHHVRMDGSFTEQTEFADLKAKPEGDDPMATDKAIAANLKERGRLFSQTSFTHSYPHCWRCDMPLLNYTASSWFVKVEAIKKQMLKNNAKTHWVPGYIRDGRYGKWLAGARDWAISRNRYWGTPLPIWRNSKTGAIEVIGSREALMQKSPDRFTKVTVVRHGESEGNLVPIYQGKEPGTDLTKEGRKQAKEVASFLKKQNVKAIYASPLARTQQTAELIAKATKTSVQTDDRIREISFGEYEGKTIDFSDLAFVRSRREKKWEENKPESIYHFPGMETWDQTHDRVSVFLNEVLSHHTGEHIVIVSHADTINNMRHFFTGEDPVKLSHQPYPEKGKPYTFYYDHQTGTQMDLHKENVDEITWESDGGTMERIPDVLDCWFESGSMPYAQQHFPFEMGHDKIPPGFPANFIAEGVDQTRAWFYTLMVLSTAIFDDTPFENVVVNGIVLAEDGKKMSKRLKNYPEPMEVVEKYGADSIRFMLMSSPAVRGENLRVSEHLIEQQMRSVLLPLWNAYAFFVLHANEADWSPPQAISDQRSAADRSTLTADRLHQLDQWIKGEVQDLVNRMTQELDAYDLSATCAELHETLDALTNWYIRRSRRRFAGKEGSPEDQQAALATLHTVLTDFCKVMAPFCPFMTEAIYLNLADDDHGSIHMTDWPKTRALSGEETALIERTRLLRTIVSLGMKLRSEANVKVRQPLSHADIVLPHSCAALSEDDVALIAEELNVKEVKLIDDPSSIAEKTLHVDARAVGPRLGGKVQEIIKAAKAGEFEENKNGSVTVLGEKLSAEEAQVVYKSKEDHAVASERGVVVALETTMNDALKLEGLARDVIRAVQQLRKDKGLKVSARVGLKAGEGVQGILKQYQSLIESETNGDFGTEGELSITVKMDGEKVSAEV